MFEKNLDFFKTEECEHIEQMKVAVIGAGALGQMAAHTLVRSDVKSLFLMDPDRMEKSNFNRQLYADTTNLGEYKVDVLKEALEAIEPEMQIRVGKCYLTKENGLEYLKDMDVILDCVDDIYTKLILEELAEQLGIVLVHGAVEGWYGQVSTIFPGDRILQKLYPTTKKQMVSAHVGVVNLVAAMQAMEVIKYAMGRGELIRHRVMFLDTLTNDYSYMNIASE